MKVSVLAALVLGAVLCAALARATIEPAQEQALVDLYNALVRAGGGGRGL